MKRFAHMVNRLKGMRPRFPRSIMEIGVWNGGSAVNMLKAFFPVDRYVGFDLFAPAPEFEMPKSAMPIEWVRDRILREAPAGVEIELVPGNTRETLHSGQWKLQNISEKFDLILVDGGHSIETIDRDWIGIQSHIGPQTVVVFDDYFRGLPDKLPESFPNEWLGNPIMEIGSANLIERLKKDKQWNVTSFPAECDVFPGGTPATKKMACFDKCAVITSTMFYVRPQ